MIAHEGVVGVGVLPNDVDISPNTILQASKKESVENSVKPAASSQTAPFLNNYYSLMEEEEDENQFVTLISPQNAIAQNQNQPQQQQSQPQTVTRTNSQ